MLDLIHVHPSTLSKLNHIEILIYTLAGFSELPHLIIEPQFAKRKPLLICNNVAKNLQPKVGILQRGKKKKITEHPTLQILRSIIQIHQPLNCLLVMLLTLHTIQVDQTQTNIGKSSLNTQSISKITAISCNFRYRLCV